MPLPFKVSITPFLDNTYAGYMEQVRNLGRDVDLIATTYPPDLKGYPCNALEITQLPFCCAVPTRHRLADMTSLELTDLYGEELMILQPGKSDAVDRARAELERHPKITLIDVPDYNPNTFNLCESTDCPLLSLECWAYANPTLKTIPISWNFTAPYGLLYPTNPSEDMRKFIARMKTILEANQAEEQTRH